MTETLTKTKIAKIKASEIVYWRVRRPASRLGLAIVWRLPRRVVYWCVVRAALVVEPNSYPGDVTAEQMLKTLGKDLRA